MHKKTNTGVNNKAKTKQKIKKNLAKYPEIHNK